MAIHEEKKNQMYPRQALVSKDNKQIRNQGETHSSSSQHQMRSVATTYTDSNLHFICTAVCGAVVLSSGCIRRIKAEMRCDFVGTGGSTSRGLVVATGKLIPRAFAARFDFCAGISRDLTVGS